MIKEMFIVFLEDFRKNKNFGNIEILQTIIDDLHQSDFFGTEGQNHPLGDMRDLEEYDDAPMINKHNFDDVINFLINEYGSTEEDEETVNRSIIMQEFSTYMFSDDIKVNTEDLKHEDLNHEDLNYEIELNNTAMLILNTLDTLDINKELKDQITLIAETVLEDTADKIMNSKNMLTTN